MSVTLSRRAVLEPLQVQSVAAPDDQGRPSYAAAVTILGRVVREDKVTVGKSGANEKTFVTIWINPDQVPLPNMDDRIVLGSEEGALSGIVVDRVEGKTLQGVVDHLRVRLREE